MLEDYIKKVQIEARVMGDLATTLSFRLPEIPNLLLENIRGLKEASACLNPVYASQKAIPTDIAEHIRIISENVTHMIEARKKANDLTDTRKKPSLTVMK